MPVWVQHIFVLALVAACLGLVAREAVRALRNQASKLAGCGSCKGCGTTEDKVGQAVKASAPPAAVAAKTAFIPADALTVRVAGRRRGRD